MKKQLGILAGVLGLVAGSVWLAAPFRVSTSADTRGGLLPSKSLNRPARTSAISPTGLGPEMEALAEKNADAAESRALALTGPERDEALGILVVVFGRTDPERSRELAERITDQEQRIQALGFALAQQASMNPDAVFLRLEQEDESGAVGGRLEKQVLPALAEIDPARVANWIAAEKVSADGVPDVLYSTIQRWTQKDARAAADWVARFEDEKLFPLSVEPLVTLWTHQDAGSAAKWIDELPEGAMRDQAAVAHAIALAVIQPEAARDWAIAIQSPALRAEALQRLEASH